MTENIFPQIGSTTLNQITFQTLTFFFVCFKSIFVHSELFKGYFYYTSLLLLEVKFPHVGSIKSLMSYHADTSDINATAASLN